jgi:hypothetical protein
MLENVPPMGHFQPIILTKWHQVIAYISKLVQMDYITIGSQTNINFISCELTLHHQN